ncbi:Gfo/Idh/MocA family oxidoreductase [Paenibacillus sp.]|uniref:Gfo/Idh/MocA family protein n=1 Tax=Paenibacillus sp. TaxID=58172 RepID=UPI002D65C43C|nr:Gfo/Idh/MocA family oxidoreductase [Paenibacillus sp.]HZG86630.1 Gfo/Idh/MocA family oxidoreductase [Paenibacillus sp.]
MVRFGIIGTNWITERFLQAGRTVEGFEAAAVCSRALERAEAYAAQHGVPHRFASVEDMAASGTVDAVYIASPNALHAEQAIRCLDLGLHVLCEKPLASNEFEAAAMIEAAKRNGALLMEAMKTTFLPNFEAIRDNLHRVGKVRRVNASYNQYSSRYDAYRAGTVLNAFDPTLSNGALMDLGVYCIYPIVRMFGAPKSVKANGVMLESGVDGAGSLLLQYEGMEAVVAYSKITHSTVPCEIQGEDGNLVFDKMSEPETVEWRNRRGEAETLTRPQSEHTMRYEIEAFMELVRRGATESPVNSHEVSLATIRIMDEARRQMGLVYPADRNRP